jgi:hypothetical protein
MGAKLAPQPHRLFAALSALVASRFFYSRLGRSRRIHGFDCGILQPRISQTRSNSDVSDSGIIAIPSLDICQAATPCR